MTDNGMKSIYQKRTRIGDNVLKALIYLQLRGDRAC